MCSATRNLLPALGAAVLTVAQAGAQSTLHVNGTCGDDTWSGLSAECGAPDGPKRSIGAAVDMTGPGDTVLVAPGVYTGINNMLISTRWHAVTLRSEAGPFSTVIDGEGSDRTFLAVETRDGGAVLVQGFTLTNLGGWVPMMADHEGDLTVMDCRFIGNHGDASGGIWWGSGAYPGTVRLVNCVFAHNSGMMTGGVMVQYGPVLEVVNCTFVDNTGGTASAIWSPRLLVYNTICRGESPQIEAYSQSAVGHCNIEGPWKGDFVDVGGNIDSDPLFEDAAEGNVRLMPSSPCIDAADNIAVPEGVPFDIGGLLRFADDPQTEDTGVGPPPVVDMGAHEFHPCFADFSGDGELGLFDFLAFVNAFNAADPAADCTGDGVLDLFDFLCFVNAFNAGC